MREVCEECGGRSGLLLGGGGGGGGGLAFDDLGKRFDTFWEVHGDTEVEVAEEEDFV